MRLSIQRPTILGLVLISLSACSQPRLQSEQQRSAHATSATPVAIAGGPQVAATVSYSLTGTAPTPIATMVAEMLPTMPGTLPTTAAGATQPPGSAQGGSLKVVVQPSRSVPPDIPDHLSWSGAGGGPDDNDRDCVSLNTATNTTDATPEVWLPTGDLRWCYSGVVEPLGSVVSATLALPDGSSRVLTSTISTSVYDLDGTGPRFAMFADNLVVSDPQGIYTFSTTLSERAMVDRFIPHVGEYVLKGWQPGELLRLLIYEIQSQSRSSTDLYFIADVRARADESGELKVQAMPMDGEGLRPIALFSIGQVTGCQLAPDWGWLDCGAVNLHYEGGSDP